MYLIKAKLLSLTLPLVIASCGIANLGAQVEIVHWGAGNDIVTGTRTTTVGADSSVLDLVNFADPNASDYYQGTDPADRSWRYYASVVDSVGTADVRVSNDFD